MAGVLLVGASTAIGAAICEAFDNAGDTVFGVSLESAENPHLAGQYVTDCSTASGAESAVRKAEETLGAIDILVNAAGAMPIGRIEDTTDAQWRGAMRASADTLFQLARHAVPRLTRGGSIVAISSVNATLAAPGVAAYAAAKGAVESLVRQLALDQASRGIRVNAVAPGFVGDGALPNAAAGYPRGSTITPAEVASAVRFLAGPEASGITGVVLPVDAGLSIASPASFLRSDLLDRLRPRRA